MKYRPDFPKRFGCIQDARDFAVSFFDWYNNHHRHSGIAYMTPHDVHLGLTEKCYEHRQQVLLAAHAANPEMFVKGKPSPPDLPTEVWTNRPREGMMLQ